MNVREETEQRLRKLIADQLSIAPEQINDAVTLEQLGADSLDRVEIVMKLEELFDIEINDDDAEKLSRFGELLDYVIEVREKNKA